MEDNSLSSPLQIQIRKVIFEKFNDTELRFTNDEIFEILKKNGEIENSWTLDDMEEYFKEICDKKVVRNIAQNFTTQWYKLFDLIEKFRCKSCNKEIYLGKSEDRVCPNPECGSTI